MGCGTESILGEIKEEQDSRHCPELMLEEKQVDVLLKNVLCPQASKFLALRFSVALCLPSFIVLSEFNVFHKMYSE